MGAGYAGDRVIPSLVPPVLVFIRPSLVPGSKLMLLTPQPFSLYFTLVQPAAALKKVEVGGGESAESVGGSASSEAVRRGDRSLGRTCAFYSSPAQTHPTQPNSGQMRTQKSF